MEKNKAKEEHEWKKMKENEPMRLLSLIFDSNGKKRVGKKILKENYHWFN